MKHYLLIPSATGHPSCIVVALICVDCMQDIALQITNGHRGIFVCSHYKTASVIWVRSNTDVQKFCSKVQQKHEHDNDYPCKLESFSFSINLFQLLLILRVTAYFLFTTQACSLNFIPEMVLNEELLDYLVIWVVPKIFKNTFG